MIFATVGTQLPFPRLMDALEEIAGRHTLEIIAQTCEPHRQGRHIKAYASMAPGAFDATFSTADVVVAHAGIGTILSAKRYGKPLILFPRRADLGEHRNEHQRATAAQIKGQKGFYLADTPHALETLLLRGDLAAPSEQSASANKSALVAHLKAVIDAV